MPQQPPPPSRPINNNIKPNNQPAPTPPQPAPIKKSAEPVEQDLRPDFEGQVADFRTEFLEFVAQTDPNVELEILRNKFVAPSSPAPKEAPSETLYPLNKEQINMPLRLSGPKVINGDIFAAEVILENEIRVKGSVYGRSVVKIGKDCVIESSVTSGGLLEIGAGSRIEGAVIGDEVRLSGPVKVTGAVYSRSTIVSQGSLEAHLLFAVTGITLGGDAASDQVQIDSSLIMAQSGKIEVSVPIHLAHLAVEPEQQQFYLSRDSNDEIHLIAVATAEPNFSDGQSTVLTTLTNVELEQLILELDKR